MEENQESKQNNVWIVVLVIAVAVFALWLKFDSDKQKQPEYIRESFKNGKQIEVEVDNSLTRDDWDCSTPDCAGHNAGYDWAEENGITDPSDCGGKSESFIEGCETYANEQSDW